MVSKYPSPPCNLGMATLSTCSYSQVTGNLCSCSLQTGRESPPGSANAVVEIDDLEKFVLRYGKNGAVSSCIFETDSP